MPSIAKCLSSRWLIWMSFLPRIIKHIKIPLLANENRQKAINLKYCHVKLTLKKKTCYVGDILLLLDGSSAAHVWKNLVFLIDVNKCLEQIKICV